jgi:hypothetical protein
MGGDISIHPLIHHHQCKQISTSSASHVHLRNAYYNQESDISANFPITHPMIQAFLGQKKQAFTLSSYSTNQWSNALNYIQIQSFTEAILLHM